MIYPSPMNLIRKKQCNSYFYDSPFLRFRLHDKWTIRDLLLPERSKVSFLTISVTHLKVNRLFGNSSRANAKSHFPPGKIMKLKALSTYFRLYFTSNKIPDIRLIRSEEVSTLVEYMDVWNKKSDKVQEILSKVEIKFDPSNFMRF